MSIRNNWNSNTHTLTHTPEIYHDDVRNNILKMQPFNDEIISILCRIRVEIHSLDASDETADVTVDQVHNSQRVT